MPFHPSDPSAVQFCTYRSFGGAQDFHGGKRLLCVQDASCSAYVASVLVDRAQPLLRSLQRASKRAEKELAEFGALPEGTPAPRLQDG